MISAYKHNLHFVCLDMEFLFKRPIKIRNYILDVGDKITYMGDSKHNSIDVSNNNGYIEYSGYVNIDRNKMLLFIPNGWKNDEGNQQLSFLDNNEEKQWYMAFLQIESNINEHGDLDYLTGPFGGVKQIYCQNIIKKY